MQKTYTYNQKNNKRKILFSVFGNVFEWYDYTLYVAFISVFTKNFFADLNFGSAKIFAFGVFSAGYLSRPLGGLLFGFIGDLKGREVALKASVWSATICTFAIGTLPTAKTIGNVAPILLILLRVLQGISVGGEFTSSAAYLVEMAPKGKKNFYGSFVMFSLAIGIIIGEVMMFLMVNMFGESALYEWAWRVPFLMSFIFGLFLMYLRSDSFLLKNKTCDNNFKNVNAIDKINGEINNTKAEFPNYSADTSMINNFLQTSCDRNKKFSFNSNIHSKTMEILRELSINKKNAFIAFFVSLGDGIPFYILCVAFPNIIGSIFNYNSLLISLIGLVAIFSYACAVLFSGYIGDKIGNKKMMLISSINLCFVPYFILHFASKNNIWIISLLSSLAGIVVGMFHGSLPNFLMKSFPESVRGTIISITYNIGMALFGSTAPMICFYILNSCNDNVAYSFKLIASFISLSSLASTISICLRKSPE